MMWHVPLIFINHSCFLTTLMYNFKYVSIYFMVLFSFGQILVKVSDKETKTMSIDVTLRSNVEFEVFVRRIYFYQSFTAWFIEVEDAFFLIEIQLSPWTQYKLYIHKTLRRQLGRFLNVFCTFNLPPVE